MADCDHVLTIESVTDPEPRTHRRIMHTVCQKCGFRQDILTTRTDKEIATEMAKLEAERQATP